MEIRLKSEITCPNCGHKKVEEMPTNACQFFYECENCKTVLKPKESDCCVYCSFGTVPCPPMSTNPAKQKLLLNIEIIEKKKVNLRDLKPDSEEHHTNDDGHNHSTPKKLGKFKTYLPAIFSFVMLIAGIAFEKQLVGKNRNL